MRRKRIRRLLKLSSSFSRSYLSIRVEVDVGRKDGLRKKRRELWLEKKRSGHKTVNQCMMATHQGLLPSIWCCATESGHVWCVPFVMNDKDAHMRMAKPCNQPQVPPITFNHNTHTIGHPRPITHFNLCTPWCRHTWLDGGAETGRPHSDDQHTMV